MKTLLYKPIFINSLAYYVFPNLNGKPTPQADTYIEPANYIGSIEVKVIAYGEVGKTVNFSNTNYIDLELFANSWVRISLYTKAGNVVLGEWKIEIEEPSYIDPEILRSLQGVWIADQNTNDSPNRNIIKNKLSNKGGDFEILNAAYKLNSGYGKYEVDYTAYAINDRNNVYTKINHSTIIGYNTTDVAQSYAFVYTDFYHENIEEYCIVIEDLVGSISYRYIDNTGKLLILKIETNGKHLLPKSYNSLPTTNQWVGYTIAPNSSASITQIPNYKGAFVTDGVEDTIQSQKHISEMTNGSNELTVISMIHQFTYSYNNLAYTNIIRSDNNNYIRTDAYQTDKTGIYGYTSKGTSKTIINNILGDKNDYKGATTNNTIPSSLDASLSISTVLPYNSSVAWYWTFIAKRALTTDEINQVIAYYNLDKYVTPDVHYNVKKQGITNENHAEFGDKLIDYSGNGKDMQLYNFGWKLDSGIGKYEFDFTTFRKYGDVVLTNNKIYVPKGTVTNVATLLYTNMTTDVNSYTVEIKGLISGTIIYYYRESNGKENRILIKEDGIYSLPKSYKTDTGTGSNMGFVLINGTILDNNGMIIIQLPSYEGALATDGVDDYGQVEGLPIYTDYTVVAERAWIEPTSNNGSLVGKSYSNSNGAFIVEQSFDSNTDWGTTYSFGQANSVAISNVKEKGFIIQSKHKYGLEKVTDIVVGTGIDNTDIMTFATVRPKDTRFSKLALWNLMLFPYSLSEFLIERQLKKHKAGTLYEGKIEFRPKISSNIPYKSITIYQETNLLYSNEVDNTGTYIQKNVSIRIHVNAGDINVVSSISMNGVTVTDLKFNSNNQYYADFDVTENIQKIDITIDEYIRFEDITQPYPAFLTFYNNDTGEVYNWGSKIKVGSLIKVNSVTNLFKDLYAIDGYKIGNKQYNYKSFLDEEIIVNKDMPDLGIITRYLIDNNPPKVLLSPERLRLSNETYKLLGYIPDLSGNGNHGVLNNFVYKDMSGADGYVEDFSAWNKYAFANVTYNKITISRNPDANWIIYTTSGHVIDPYSIKVSGIPSDGELVYRINNVNTVLVNGINKLDGATVTAASGFYITKHGNTYWRDLVIEQVGKYEGSVTFDGVEDFVSIPTLYPNGGGKQLLMKLNWKTLAKIIYDQRGNPDEFAIFTGMRADNSRIAYNGRNNGNTYIDGALNDSIPFTDLQNVTHNITITNPLLTGRNFSTPIIGSNIVHTDYFSDLSMYTFMLFDEISTDDNILKLNEIIGIEVKPETNN